MAECANCEVYGWEQAASVTLRCSRCKVPSYCGKECQAEHWEKNHKQQCQALAGRKPEPLAQHRGAACSACQPGSGAWQQCLSGSSAWQQCQAPGSRPLACHLEFSFGREFAERPTLGFEYDGAPEGEIRVPLPFPLGEMAGRFRTKVEHTVSLMQSIVFKMDTSGHPILRLPATKRNIRVGLNEMREDVWYTSVEVPDGQLEDALAHKVSRHRVLDWFDLGIPEVSKLYRIGKSEHVEIWDVFLVLKFFLRRNFIFNGKRDFEHWPSDKLPEEIQGDLENITSCETFSQRWEEVLAAVAGGLGPYSALVGILCGGQLEQRCSGCGDAVTVTSALLYTGSGSGLSAAERIALNQLHRNRVIGKAFVIFGLTTVFCCRQPACQSSVCDAATARHTRLMAAYQGLAARCEGNCCDSCFLLCSKVHRCTGCFTKVYCGAACQDADWGVHQRFCQTGAPARKRKAGQSGRKEHGAECLDRLAERVASCELATGPLGVVKDFFQRMF